MSTLDTRPNTTLTTLFDTAAQIADQPHRSIWTGPSGETITGEQTARHLEAAAALLDERGWSRTYALSLESGTPEPKFPDFTDVESLTIKAIILRLLKFARDLYVHETSWTVSRSLTLSDALGEADDGVHGDGDTRRVAEDVLDVLLRASTGAESACCRRWSSKVGRTQEDVLELLAVGAMFARRYGPGSRATILAA